MNVSSKKKVLILGNILIKTDSYALKAVNQIKKSLIQHYEFQDFDPTEGVLENIQGKPVFIDSSPDINEVILIKNLDNIALSPRNSLHDFDLPLELGLLIKLRKISGFSLIVVPQRNLLKKEKDKLTLLIRST